MLAKLIVSAKTIVSVRMQISAKTAAHSPSPRLPQITPRISHLSLRHDFFRRDLVRLLCCRGDIKDINPQALCCPDQQISHDLTRSN